MEREGNVRTALRWALPLALGIAAAGGKAAAADQLMIYGGVQAKNGWEDVLTEPGTWDFYDDGLVGLAYAHQWHAAEPGWSLGFEAQANLHFGGQSYLELNLPVVLRYAPPWRIPIRSFAYGLGPSVTSSVPEIEIDKGGDSQRVLFYWYMEAEFGHRGQQLSGFVRLHHRSNGFGTFDKPGSSNAVVLGLRRYF